MFKTKTRISIITTISSIALATFIFLMTMVMIDKNLSIDRIGAIWAENRVLGLDWFFKIFTYGGSVYAMIGVSILLLIFMRDKKTALAVIMCLIVVGVTNFLFKQIVARPRPDYGLIEETGKSFPSGHAMISMGYYGFLIYLASKLNRGWRLAVRIALPISIILFGISRVYLGVHYMSDVIAGWCLGFVILVLFTFIYEQIMKRRNTACQKQ